jgi:phosphatidylinositol glycan class O
LEGNQSPRSTRAAFQRALARVALAYSLFTSIGVLVSTAFVARERRHLMVWAIFAPKFAFEACGIVVSEALMVAGVAGACKRLGRC